MTTTQTDTAPIPTVKKYLVQDTTETNLFYYDMKIGDEVKRIKFRVVWNDMLGNVYYAFLDNKDIPALRHLAGKTAVSQSEWGFDKRGLLAHLQRSVEKHNAGDHVGGCHELQTIINRVTATDPVKALMRLATVYFIMDGERPDTFDADMMLKKLDAMEQDPSTKVFFLNEALAITESLDVISKAGTIQFLVANTLLQSQANTQS